MQDELSVSVTNDGLGPAVIKSVTLTLGGRHFNDVDSVVTAIVPGRNKLNGSISSSNITPSSVIRPSETVTILDAKGTHSCYRCASAPRRSTLQSATARS